MLWWGDGRRFYQPKGGSPAPAACHGVTRTSRPGGYAPAMRRLLTAELLAIGSELTVGETRDTNSGDLARALTSHGVRVRRTSALPDDLGCVREAIEEALRSVDLVVLTGGLGPTPDDLTREAIAATLGERPAVDPALERWLRALFERRSVAFPEANLKQAWLIPSATPIPNDHGTAPGWWVDGPEERVVVALPGPPREMRAMWSGHVEPRLIARGLGADVGVVTLRTTRLGESLVADRIRSWLEGADPEVATYARSDAVDVRISGEPRAVARAEDAIRVALDGHVWATGTTSWAEAIADALGTRSWRLSTIEIGTRGSLIGLLGDGLGDRLLAADVRLERPRSKDGRAARLEELAVRNRSEAGADVAVALEVVPRRGDTAVRVAVRTPTATHRERRLVFLADAQGRARAAVAAADVLLRLLRG